MIFPASVFDISCIAASIKELLSGSVIYTCELDFGNDTSMTGAISDSEINFATLDSGTDATIHEVVEVKKAVETQSEKVDDVKYFVAFALDHFYFFIIAQNGKRYRIYQSIT